MHAFVDIFVDSQLKEDVMQALSEMRNVEGLYEVRGECDIVTFVSAKDVEEFRDTLKNKIRKIPGVRTAVSSVVLRETRHVPKHLRSHTKSQIDL